jgi:hypothetical protein
VIGQLPSEIAARALIRGEAGGLGSVVYWTLLRAGLIGAGLYVAGERQNLTRNALAGALAVEIGVLFFAWREERG